MFRVGPSPGETEDAVADLHRRDELAHGVHDTGELETRDVARRVGRGGVGAHALEEVGAVDRGRPDADAGFTPLGDGSGNVAERENFGTAGGRDDDCAHGLVGSLAIGAPLA